MAMQSACLREIGELHDFFQAWMRGELPRTDAAFARFPAALDARFMLISPAGQAAGVEETVAWIRSAHGSRPDFRLWTTDHQVRFEAAGCVLATYQEWQTRDGVTTTRLSSVLFRADPAAPNGVAWVHVHETWLAQD